MTEQEKKAVEALNHDLPKYSISDGTRRFIAMDLAKKGYCKAEDARKDVIDEFFVYALRFTDGRTKRVSIEDLKEIALKVFGVEVGE